MIALVCLESPAPGRASRAALDLACTLAGGVQVVALSAGGSATSSSLELARRTPAVSRIIHLDEPSLDTADFFTLGLVLAEAARHLEAGIIITGERSDDEGQGLVPAALAHHRPAHLISRVRAIRFSSVTEMVETTTSAGGQRCTIACRPPVVLATPPAWQAGPSANASSPVAVETLRIAQLGLDASRLVPRPDLLGALVPAPAENVREMTLEEASAALLRHR